MSSSSASSKFRIVLLGAPASGKGTQGQTLAAELGIPVVWAIHESFPPSVLLANFDPGVRERTEQALASAAALVFEAEATKRLYEPIAGAERCAMHPYGLDLEPIDAHRAEFDGGAARREAGIPADAELVVCVGTVEPRNRINPDGPFRARLRRA